VYVGFSRCKILRCSAYTISEKAIRFRHPDYNPDKAQKLISSSRFRHLWTRNILSKSMHAFLSNLANRQTDKRTRAKHLPPPLSEVISHTSLYCVLIQSSDSLLQIIHGRPGTLMSVKNVARIITIDGCENGHDIAMKFASHFANVYQRAGASHTPTHPAAPKQASRSGSHSIAQPDLCRLITPEMVGLCIHKLTLGKACDPDDLSVEHLLYAHPSIVLALCISFRMIFVYCFWCRHNCSPS